MRGSRERGRVTDGDENERRTEERREGERDEERREDEREGEREEEMRRTSIAVQDMRTAVRANAIARERGAHLLYASGDEAVLQAGSEQWTLPVRRFADYRTDSERAILTSRAYILPAREEDGLYAHPAWIGERGPPPSTPRRSRKGHVYLNRYVRAGEGDGTWISLRSRHPLNTGAVSLVEEMGESPSEDGKVERGERGGRGDGREERGEGRDGSEGGRRYAKLGVDVVVSDILFVREEHFTRYNFSSGLRSAFLVAMSRSARRESMQLWADTQTSSSVSVPRTFQGTHTLSATVRYGSRVIGGEEARTTSVSLSVDI